MVRCGAVVLATGGCGRVFEVTSNSWESTGDGYGMAFRAGATLRDMEMIQFHPTGMVHPEGVKGKLVTEAVRGEGGRLFNSEGERFMERYAPDWMELAPRDVVSTAIYREIAEGRGTVNGGVYLDATHLPAEEVERELPAMVSQFRDFAGIDITEESMEVAPTAHYMMGGVGVDPETCETDVKGLFAAGEAASGVHGANRLGTNSLADIVVFGRRAGEAATRHAEQEGKREAPREKIRARIDAATAPLSDGRSGDPYGVRAELQSVMWRHVGIERSGDGLEGALREVSRLAEEAGALGVRGGSFYNPEWVEAANLRNMVQVCEMAIRSALLRRESRGAHRRRDHPESDEEWRANVYCRAEKDGMEVWREGAPEPPESTMGADR